jgi:hypothetical protein
MHAQRDGWTYDSGYLDVLTPADPAAGANLTVTIPNQRLVVVRSLTVTLTTDANVANRLVSVDYLLGTRATAKRNLATVLITASTTAQVFHFDNQHTVSEWNTGTPILVPLQPIPLPNGWTVQVTVDSKQAGDQLASCLVVVDRYWQEHRDSGGGGSSS